jgi:hypothetical protein
MQVILHTAELLQSAGAKRCGSSTPPLTTT